MMSKKHSKFVYFYLMILFFSPWLFGCALGLDPSLQELEEGQSLWSVYSESEEIRTQITSSNISSEVLNQGALLRERQLNNKSDLSEEETNQINQYILSIENEKTRLEIARSSLSPEHPEQSLIAENIETLNVQKEIWEGIVESQSQWITAEGSSQFLKNTGAILAAGAALPIPGVNAALAISGAVTYAAGALLDWFFSDSDST